jgi:hypothetical protein
MDSGLVFASLAVLALATLPEEFPVTEAANYRRIGSSYPR